MGERGKDAWDGRTGILVDVNQPDDQTTTGCLNWDGVAYRQMWQMQTPDKCHEAGEQTCPKCKARDDGGQAKEGGKEACTDD